MENNKRKPGNAGRRLMVIQKSTNHKQDLGIYTCLNIKINNNNKYINQTTPIQIWIKTTNPDNTLSTKITMDMNSSINKTKNYCLDYFQWIMNIQHLTQDKEASIIASMVAIKPNKVQQQVIVLVQKNHHLTSQKNQQVSPT